MTVQELIEKLEKLPKDMEVVVCSPQYWDGDTYYNPPNLNDRFITGKDLFFVTTGSYIYKLQSEMKDEWGVVALPMGPNSNSYHIPNNYTPYYGIINNAQSPEDLAYVLKELASPAISSDQMTSYISIGLFTAENGFDPAISQRSVGHFF